MGSFLTSNNDLKIIDKPMNGSIFVNGLDKSFQQLKRDQMIKKLEMKEFENIILTTLPTNKYLSKIISEYYNTMRSYNDELLINTYNLKNITNEFSDKFFKLFKCGIFKHDNTWYLNTYMTSECR